MKSLLFFLSFSFFFLSVTAQTFPKKGDYVKNPLLNNLSGTWQGINGNDTFTVIFKYRSKMAIPPIYVDALKGWHQYSSNGVIESTSLAKLGNDKEATALFFSLKPIDLNNELIIQFGDPNKSRGSVEVSFKLMPGKTDEAIWKVKNFHEGTHDLYKEGHPRKVRPPVSKLTAIPEWHMKKIN